MPMPASWNSMPPAKPAVSAIRSRTPPTRCLQRIVSKPVVPVFVSIVVLALGVPRPSWLVPAPWVPRWRSLPLLVPALSHGAKLAACWLPGALAARAYEREAYDGTVEEAVRRVHVYAGPRTTALARCTPLLKD